MIAKQQGTWVCRRQLSESRHDSTGRDGTKMCKTGVSHAAPAARDNPPRNRRASMQMTRSGLPMLRIALDIQVGLPVTDGGNRCILVVSDYFTRWAEAYALPNQEATTVARKLVDEFVCRHGVPESLHSDQGADFESKLFTEMCKILGIHKTRTTAYHPQSDGLV